MIDLKARIEKVLLNRASQGTQWASVTADEIIAAIEQPDKTSHSPLPWNTTEIQRGELGIQCAGGGATIAKLFLPREYAEANRDLILKAVNSHEKLVALAQRVIFYARDGYTLHRNGALQIEAENALRSAGIES